MLEKLLAAIIALTEALNRVASGGTAPAPGAAAAGAAGAVTVEQVREKMKELMDKKGKEAVVAVLAAVGAKKLGDVTPANLGIAFQKANEALTAAAPQENLFG